MANPWDPNKIKNNLHVLAKLQPGQKLQFLDNGSIRVNNNAFLRRSRDSITSQRVTTMFDTLFKEAVKLSEKAGAHSKDNYNPRSKPGAYISIGEIDNAIRGVEKLRETYKGDNQKLSKVNDIIRNIQGTLQTALQSAYGSYQDQEMEEVRKEIYATFKRNMLVKVDHHRLLGIGERGVCMVFTQDWIRRNYLEARPTYAVSGSFWRGFFPKPVEDRLQEKVDKRLRPISSGYGDYAHGRVSDKEKSKWVALPYGKGLHAHKDLAKGIVKLQRTKTKQQEIPEGLEFRQNGIIQRGQGKRVFLDIMNSARVRVPFAPHRLAMFNFSIWGGFRGGYRFEVHSIGLKLEQNSPNVTVFDSNLGEFLFNGDAGLGQFGELWWKMYVVLGVAIDRWTLYEWGPIGK